VFVEEEKVKERGSTIRILIKNLSAKGGVSTRKPVSSNNYKIRIATCFR
jgi:hypothetical protein